MTLVEQTKHPKRNPVAANGHNGHIGQALIVSVKFSNDSKCGKINEIWSRYSAFFVQMCPKKRDLEQEYLQQ